MAPTGINRPGYSSSPTGINRPGYSSPKTPTNVNRPGTSSPNFSGYSKPSNRPTSPGSGYTPGGDSFQNYSQKDQATMFNQAGGKDKFIQQAIQQQQKYPRALNYQKYLDDAKRYQAGQILGGQEVMGADGIMRLQMAGADTPMKDAQGRTILSMQAPTLTAQAPTFKQLMGDMGRGLGSIGQGLVEKGTPMMNLAKSLFGGVQNFFGNQIDKAQGFFANQMASQNQFNQQLSSLTPQQRMVYDQLIFQPGMTRENAYAQAVGQGFAMGGIATLH